MWSFWSFLTPDKEHEGGVGVEPQAPGEEGEATTTTRGGGRVAGSNARRYGGRGQWNGDWCGAVAARCGGGKVHKLVFVLRSEDFIYAEWGATSQSEFLRVYGHMWDFFVPMKVNILGTNSILYLHPWAQTHTYTLSL